jgi:hypothetical protein
MRYSPWSPTIGTGRNTHGEGTGMSDEHQDTALEDDQLHAAVIALEGIPAGRLRRLAAKALDAGVLDIGGVMLADPEQLAADLERAVVEGRIAEPGPPPAPGPTHYEDGRPIPKGEELLQLLASVRRFPADLWLPAAAATAQGILDRELLEVLHADELRELLRSAVAQGRLVNERHLEDPECWPAWSL